MCEALARGNCCGVVDPLLLAAIQAAWTATRTPVPTEFLGAVKAEMSGARASQKYALRFHELSMRPIILKAHARLRKASGIAPLSGSELRKRFIDRAKDLLGESLAAAVVESKGSHGAPSMALSQQAGWKGREPGGADFVPMLERSLRYIRNTTIDSSVIFRFNKILDPPAEPDLVEYVVQRPEGERERAARLEREADAAFAEVGRLDVVGDGIRTYGTIARAKPSAGRAVRFFRHLRQHPDDPDTRHPNRRPIKTGTMPVTGSFPLEWAPVLLEDDDEESDEPAGAATAGAAVSSSHGQARRTAPARPRRAPNAPPRLPALPPDGESEPSASSAAARAETAVARGLR